MSEDGGGGAPQDGAGHDQGVAVGLSYEEVAYPSLAHPRAHLEPMALHARLFGFTPADLAACAVLEVGCGDGSHLIPMAEAYPGSRFLGLDLSEEAVARGRADIAALGLTNVTLEAADIRAWSPPPGSFDYAIAHGLYAWTPPDVREALMAAFGVGLREGGIAFVSYNLAPGCNVRLMLRELLAFELRGVDGWRERMEKGRAALEEAVALLKERTGGHSLEAMKSEAGFWESAPRPSLLHDLLAPVYAPQRLVDVVAHGARHGLAFLGDTDRSDVRRVAFPDLFDRRMEELSHGDPVEAEHRHDLRQARTFRHTLLRKGPPGARRLEGEAVRGLHVSLSRKQAEEGLPEPAADGVWTLRLQTEDFAAAVEGEGPREILKALLEVYPATVPVADLGLEQAGLSFLLLAYGGGAVKLWTRPLGGTSRAGTRPRARRFARLQARRRGEVTRIDHESQRVDPTALVLLALCDGRADLPAIARAMARETGIAADVILGALPANLDGLARRGLILAEDAT